MEIFNISDLNDAWLSREVQREQAHGCKCCFSEEESPPAHAGGALPIGSTSEFDARSPFREPDTAVMRLSAKEQTN